MVADNTSPQHRGRQQSSVKLSMLVNSETTSIQNCLKVISHRIRHVAAQHGVAQHSAACHGLVQHTLAAFTLEFSICNAMQFRQLVPLLTNKDISLIVRGRLYSSCVRSSMMHGSETWSVRKENG